MQGTPCCPHEKCKLNGVVKFKKAKDQRMERSRRQPKISSASANKKSALEALKAAREGGAKRVSNFEVKEEGALYDVVTEQDYASLAAKRRAEGGSFSYQASVVEHSALLRPLL
jgi:hypothetical protein